jgi:hypothetical protein
MALGSPINLQRFTQGVDAMVRIADDIPSLADLRLALTVISQFSFRSNALS